jgi:chaperone BCS1
VTAKSSKRKYAIDVDPVASIPGALNADYVPKWGTPHMFRWRGYWVDVIRSSENEESGGRRGGPFGMGGSAPGQITIT